MITLARRVVSQIYDKLLFFGPVIIVIIVAAFLVYCTFLADIIVTAAVVTEEGTGSEAASAGVVNALTFIIPAIVGGFGIALLFKYRKKVTLKFFFGGALFFAGSFIIYFFSASILYIIQIQSYSLFILDFNPDIISITDLPPIIYLDVIYPILIFCCGFAGFWITFIITSKKFDKPIKNRAILLQSALMGAFLSVILPTFTVIILLIGLSLYDIYSVRRGPIKDIVRYTMEDEINQYRNNNPEILSNDDFEKDNKDYTKNTRMKFNGKTINEKNYFDTGICKALFCVKSVDDNYQTEQKLAVNDRLNEDFENININQQPKLKKRFKLFKANTDNDEVDSMLTSMTYSARDWDVGIGDLVFYSMLASQPLTPYFIYTHGIGLFNTYGLWIFWLISLFTIIGILIGFIITIRLLERNSMLPGLPCSIALGLTGFGLTYIILLLI